MVEKDYPRLSVAAQCRLLSIPRSTFYHRPAGESAENLCLMALIDRQFMETPFYGVRQMTWHLRNEGHAVNPKRVRRLMRLMGLMPIYRKPNTSRPARGRQPFPYLLRGLAIDRPNQVWCADITYLPMRRGFLYLVAIMDWHSRRVLSWRLSNTLEAQFCADALDEAITRFGPPEIMNTDQGSQFTAFAWTDRLRQAGVRISMDGKGRFLDNIFIERLWRSLKYECVYLHAWETGSEARAGLRTWFDFYNVSSQRTSRYVFEGNRDRCGSSGPAGVFPPVRARATRARTASASRSVRLKSHGPSGSGCLASTSPRSADSRRVFAATPTRAAALVRLSQGSGPSFASR
jgi:putative transposase